MTTEEKISFISDYEFQKFTYPKFEIDGTISHTGCDLFIYDTELEFEIVLRFTAHKDEIAVFSNSERIAVFNFCENFEEKLFEIYKQL